MGQELQLVTQQKLSLGLLTTSQEAGPLDSFSQDLVTLEVVWLPDPPPKPREAPPWGSLTGTSVATVGRVPQTIFLFLQPGGQVLLLSSPAPS